MAKSNLEQDREALALYLEHWQNEEAPNHPIDTYYQRDKALERLNRNNEISLILVETGYRYPNEVVYDNEACPLGVIWKDENFDLSIEFYNLTESNE